MTIGLIETSISDLDSKYQKVLDLVDNKSYRNLDKATMDKMFNILSDKDFQDLHKKIRDPRYFQDMDYENLNFLSSTVNKIDKAITRVKEEYDINVFLKDGYVLDEKELKEKYSKSRVLKKRHPKLNIKRLLELYKNPPTSLKAYYSEDEILIDQFVYRKYMIAIVQMIFNHMDLVIAFCGSEGTGKSVKASQDMYMMWWTLKEIGIIDYAFDIKEMFFNTLHKLREAEDKYFHNPFRIFGLDEGNELNRQDWKEDEVKTFFQRLRRERYNQRIKFVLIPVLGEMITNIILSRVNFTFEMVTKNNIKSGTLKKGLVKMYIIPRGDFIYSPEQSREISKDEIKKSLYENLKDKSYLTGIPRNLLVKKFNANGVWAWPEKLYNENLKESNETFSVSKGINISEIESFIFYKSNVRLRALGIKPKDPRYSNMAKIVSKINKFWENSPEKLLKFESIYKRKYGEFTQNA